MNQPTRGDYDITDVNGYDQLRDALEAVSAARSHEDRVSLVSDMLLNGHEGSSGYLVFGNNKVHKNTGIFNMNSATDCPNADSSESDPSDVGVCQVPWDSCYAHKTENIFKDALPKRRLQEYFWDSIDAFTFAHALLDVKDRKRSPFENVRVSESGDFRHDGDIIKWNTISEIVSDELNVYTYSASHKLNWDHAEHFTVNQSNSLADYGDRRFTALPEGSDLPEGMVWCAFDYSDKSGDDRPQCGECQLCINKDGPDVAIELH